MAEATNKFVSKQNMTDLVKGLKGKYEPKDATLVKDASYVHTDNNFDDTAKNKLTGIAEGAEVNIINEVKVNGDALTPAEGGSVNVTVPTTLTGLTNDGNFVQDPSYVHTDNNFDSDAVTKLNGITAGAQPNVIEGIVVGSEDATVTGKKVTLGTAAGATTETTLTDGQNLPTGSAVKGFVEGKGYQTASDVTSAIESYGYQTAAQVTSAIESYGYQTASDVASAVANAQHLKKEVVEALPATGQENVLYLVPDDKGGDNKDMYIYDSGDFILIGNTETDLADYAKTSDFAELSADEVEAILAEA